MSRRTACRSIAVTMAADRETPSADSQGREPAPAGPDEANDPVEQLQRLAELREQGVLTEDEFIAEKRNILQS
jgi:hypothetical protein